MGLWWCWRPAVQRCRSLLLTRITIRRSQLILPSVLGPASCCRKMGWSYPRPRWLSVSLRSRWWPLSLIHTLHLLPLHARLALRRCLSLDHSGQTRSAIVPETIDLHSSFGTLDSNTFGLSHRNRPIHMSEHMQCPGSGGPPLSDRSERGSFLPWKPPLRSTICLRRVKSFSLYRGYRQSR